MTESKDGGPYNLLHRVTLRLNLNYFGVVVGTVLYLLSLTPSLMPRAWLLQGFVSALAFAIGYSFGTFASWAFRGLFEYEFSTKTKHLAWNVFPVVGLVLLALFLSLYVGWQEEIRQIGGFEPTAAYEVMFLLIVSGIFTVIFIGIGKLVRKLFESLIRLFSRRLPRRVSMALGLGAASLITIWVFNGFINRVFIGTADAIYSSRNSSDPEGYSVPPWPEHSGSSQSLIPWETIGYQGKKFVADTSTVAEMTEFSGEPALQPIRLYAGVDSADTARERAKLVIEEMRRTKAMERDVLLVVTPTGSGWIEPNSIRAVEHMYNGDIATVSMQYSYLPSWIATLVDPARAKETGRVLFETVYEEWVSYPENDRPELIVYGLSLGSFGGQSAFSSTSDLAARTDGALFLGTPNFSNPWRLITDSRDDGSKEVRPIYQNGKVAVFGGDKEDILENNTYTERPRVLFQQHASDGVVWWHPELILHQPDWIKEEPGKGVIDDIFWIPFVTFFQVTVDQAVAGGAPDGFGHNYRDTLVYAWASVVPPEDWTNEKSDRLQAKIFQVESKGGSNL